MKWVYLAFAIVGALTPGMYLFSRFRVNSLIGDADLVLLSLSLGLVAAPLFFGVALVMVRLVHLGLRFLRGSYLLV